MHRVSDAKRRTPGLVALIVAFACMIGSAAVGYFLLSPLVDQRELDARDGAGPAMADPFALPDAVFMLVGYTAFIFVFLWLWLRLWEGRKFVTLGLDPGSVGKGLRGVLFAMAAVTVWASILIATGAGTLEIAAAEVPLTALLAALALMPLAWAVQTGSEEIIFRGFLLQTVGQRHGLILGVVVSCVVFALAHAGNGIGNAYYFAGVFLLAIFLCLYAIAENSLWGVWGFHLAWNFSQSQVFGIRAIGDDVSPNRLFVTLDQTPRLMRLQATQSDISLAAIGLTLVLILIAFFALMRNTRPE
ncbi:CPBP family intramembrane metalloprotease [Aquisalinus flavus]|uniref:CPBP family intramembrane glutamic endopeptidase n=1 Tax=Aquisalinus flavus TaxID=1526572 RepID=UPI00165FAE2B|nr:type II CAAX endopeptidase family protein [Aquisalinus flavus]MBD0428108.1 CPBP family intramembrane metalloprotease [Aquisalinus flavus]